MGVEKIFNIWNSTVRDVYNVPRMTRTYIVENLLSIHRGFKADIMSRFVKFYKNLLSSPSSHVRILAALLHTDVRSTTGHNLALIATDIEGDPLAMTKRELMVALDKRKEDPDDNFLEEVNTLIGISLELKMNGLEQSEEMEDIKRTLDDLCV